MADETKTRAKARRWRASDVPVSPTPQSLTATTFAAKAKDLSALRDAVAETAGVSGGLWFSYLFVFLYLAIAVGGVSHRDLFFENPVKLPFVNVELPLIGFFVLGPLLFLIVHAYVLLHFVLLSGKVGAFHAELQSQIADEGVRAQLRRQLPSSIFVQLLAGPREVRVGVMGLMLRLIAQISLVAAPIALLALFQLQFLPYHQQWISWWHRTAITADLALLWALWPSIARGEIIWLAWRDLRRVRVIALLLASLFPIFLAFAVATFPGEWLHENVSRIANPVAVSSDILFRGSINEITGAPRSVFSNVLVLPDQTLIDTSKLEKSERTVSLRGRDLRGAVLDRSDLRRADFTGANLSGAQFSHARLQQTKFACAVTGLNEAQLSLGEEITDREEKSLYALGWPNDGCTWLEGASLWGAELQGALLDFARLKGANLNHAYLQGDSLKWARLQGAQLFGAQLQGGLLNGSHLQGAHLTYATLQGASLVGAHLQATQLQGTALQGASLDGAKLQAAAIRDANLEGASLSGTNLQGTGFYSPRLWRVQGQPEPPEFGIFANLNFSRMPFEDQKFDLWLDNILVTLPDNASRARVKERLLVLDPRRPAPSDALTETFWTEAIQRDRTLTAGARADFAFALLKELACDDAENAPFVARRFIIAGRFGSTGEHRSEMVKLLKDPAKCPGAVGLTSKELLHPFGNGHRMH